MVKQAQESFEDNLDWFTEHYDELEKNYGNKVLAIKNRKVIAVSASLEKLLDELRNRQEDISSIYMGSIPPKGMAFIL
ncbi:MAG: hypothetical protein NWF03_02650 [Candidatus Bathyarchaeota archaeon]|nr:hypothetical protein [Candidatus Bathyarchaeota archaeon]